MGETGWMADNRILVPSLRSIFGNRPCRTSPSLAGSSLEKSGAGGKVHSAKVELCFPSENRARLSNLQSRVYSGTSDFRLLGMNIANEF
jgi:hypothetical protein